ncbi:hypothetical protein [Rhizobium beringeri]|uniref:hypothetical protein n=1 Tax=Rhizobium beringeri TaxID=3019934 RepID=UPI003B5BF57C
MASMEAATSLERFIAAVQNDFEEKLAAVKSTRRPNAKSSSTAMVEELKGKFASLYPVVCFRLCSFLSRCVGFAFLLALKRR